MRRWYFLTFFMSIIDDRQLATMSGIIDTYSDDYDELLQCRAAILEKAHDGDNTAELLRANQMATFKLSRNIRNRLIREVLDNEQKRRYAELFEKPYGVPATAGPAPSADDKK
jgi:hypothetical protein